MLDQGVYTLAEASKYTGINPVRLRNWFRERSDEAGRGPIFKSDYAMVGDDFAISFLNMIESYVVSQFRVNKMVKPSHIRKVHRLLQDKMGTAHPFAHADLRVASPRIVENDGDATLSDVLSGQIFLDHVRPFVKPILYGITTKMAESWDVHAGVTINPKIGFGKPTVAKTGVSTLIIARQFVANGMDAALVARLYRITAEGVQSAYDYEVGLGRIAA
jgi:uncharacterized protein (DUF433 family)